MEKEGKKKWSKKLMRKSQERRTVGQQENVGTRAGIRRRISFSPDGVKGLLPNAGLRVSDRHEDRVKECLHPLIIESRNHHRQFSQDYTAKLKI